MPERVSMAPTEGKPQIMCPKGCGATVGVVLVDPGTLDERELLVDLGPIPTQSSGLVWVKTFSGHPPRGDMLEPGVLHRIHHCE